MTGEGGLERFVEAQVDSYATALAEIRVGAKRSHWMWYIFPQLRGLGHSTMAQFYAIASLEEAVAYLGHPVLGARYDECVRSLQNLTGNEPAAIFGPIDALKLGSSLTLFEHAQPSPLFGDALDRWFGGRRDRATLGLLS